MDLSAKVGDSVNVSIPSPNDSMGMLQYVKMIKGIQYHVTSLT